MMSSGSELIHLYDKWCAEAKLCSDHTRVVGSAPIASAEVFTRCANELLSVLKGIHESSEWRALGSPTEEQPK